MAVDLQRSVLEIGVIRANSKSFIYQKNQFLGSCEGCMANVIMVKPKGISKHGVLPCALAGALRSVL